jgi:hypothetical protein
VLFLRGAIFFLAVLMALTACEDEARAGASESAGTSSAYVMPSQFFIHAQAERQPDGAVVIEGDTNLPENLKIGVDIYVGKRWVAQDWNVFVVQGHFRSLPLNEGLIGPSKKTFAAGKYRVIFISIFNGNWQTPAILDLVGDGGTKLKGSIFSLKDPDVIDSDKELNYPLDLAFPPLSDETRGILKKEEEQSAEKKREMLAINLVKKAYLTVPGEGRSSERVEELVSELFKYGGVRPAKGWSANRTAGTTYTVTFDCIDPSPQDPERTNDAIWTANLKTGEVHYINKNAKNLSWAPNY